jgi:hypothetical protein
MIYPILFQAILIIIIYVIIGYYKLLYPKIL